MKRGGPLKRNKGLDRGSGLKPGKGLKQGAALARTGKLKQTRREPDDPVLKAAFEAHFKFVRCVICGKDHRDPAHHIVPKQELRAYAEKLGWSRERTQILLWDPRNGLSLCLSDHARHETAYRRVPRYLLPKVAFDFVHEHGFEPVIERFYPVA